MLSSLLESNARLLTYFPALTGVRAIAALLVFFTHSNPFEECQSSHKWAYAFVHQGHFGVPIFFVLSGFLIATRYMGRIEPTWQWWRTYMQNRVARIYPLYFLLTAFTFFVYEVNPSYDFLSLWSFYRPINKVVIGLLNFTFLRGFFASYFYSGISQGWSLTAEETFYVLAPVILWSAAGRYRQLLLWAAGLLATGLLLVAVFSPLSIPLRGLFGSMEFMFQWTFFGHVLEFVLGIGLAIFVAEEKRTSRPGAWATYGGIVWILGCAAFVATMEQEQTLISNEHLKILTINFLLPPGIGFLFYGLLRESTIIRRMLETKMFDLLGKSSYAFYLLHLGVLSVWLHKLGSPIVVSLIVTMLLSIVLFKLVEEPLHKRIKSW